MRACAVLRHRCWHGTAQSWRPAYKCSSQGLRIACECTRQTSRRAWDFAIEVGQVGAVGSAARIPAFFARNLEHGGHISVKRLPLAPERG